MASWSARNLAHKRIVKRAKEHPTGRAPMPHTLPARGVMLAELEAAIRKAEAGLRWRGAALRAVAAFGRDTSAAAILLRQAEVRVAGFRQDRRFLLRAGRG